MYTQLDKKQMTYDKDRNLVFEPFLVYLLYSLQVQLEVSKYYIVVLFAKEKHL